MGLFKLAPWQEVQAPLATRSATLPLASIAFSGTAGAVALP